MKNRFFFYLLLLMILAGVLYFNNNAGDIYAKIGNFYYKRNEINKAQTFFEKSFNLGNTDSSFREMYVNSIINSPLTLDSQEKLINIAEGIVEDGASVKAKYFLYDLRREIHNQYLGNYIQHAPLNQQIVRWNKFPITYSFQNANDCPPVFRNEINKAFLDWERVSSIMFAEVKDKPDIIITFQNAKDRKLEHGAKYVVAYTVPNINGSVLNSMNIVFNLQDPEKKIFTKNQIYNTALHEIFHALGFMGHSFDTDNIMYLAKDNNKYVDDSRADLTEADINTLKLLYKIKPDITNQGNLKSEYMPYLVLGDDIDITLSKSREAKKYIHYAPSLPTGYIDMAENLVAQKKYPEAIKNLEKALSLSDTNELKYISYYNLAVCYYYINHTEMALGYLGKAMEIRDNNELHFLKAEILKDSDMDAAIKEYEKLVKNYPDNKEYTLRLVNIYVNQRNYLKARKVLKNFLKRNPSKKDDPQFKQYGILVF